MTNTHTDRLRASNIAIGQEFVDATHGRWTNSRHSERRVVVTHKTKTRLVVALMNDQGVVTDRTKRIIVREGVVTDKVEGEARSQVLLYTDDDPGLAAMRARSAYVDLRYAAQRAAGEASRNIDTESAQKAVEALQAYLAASNPEED